MQFMLWIIVGLIAGWITGNRMRGYGYGPLMDILMGIAGAVVAGFIMRFAGYSGQGVILYTTLVAILGAVILTVLIGLVSGRSRYA